MITSDRQLEASKKQLAMLNKSQASPVKKDIPERIAKAGKAQLQELIDEIQTDVNEYEVLKQSTLEDIKISSFDDLVTAPIKYRIVKRLSVDAFGRLVGISARQIHRYEADNYCNTNTETLMKVISGLGIELNGNIAIKDND